MVGAEREKYFKNEDPRSSEMAISEFYQRLFERLVSSLIGFLVVGHYSQLS